nr:oxygenase MpaB family protein [Kineococcus siccus]
MIADSLRAGDPAADAVAEEVAARPATRGELEAALRGDAAALRGASAAVRALVEESEAAVRSVDDEVHDRDSRPFFTISLSGHAFDLGTGALIDSYRPPRSAELLVSTGRLTESVLERLRETARWVSQVMVPGWLRPGQPGFVATVGIRVVHALVRRGALRRNPSTDHLPVSQLEMARTWLDFTYVAMQADQALGLDLTPAEQHSVYRYWQPVGRLLGVDARLIGDVTDAASARRLLHRVDGAFGPPSEDSRRLTSAALTAISGELPSISLVNAPLARVLVRTVARRMQGPELADVLGIPRTGLLQLGVPPAVAAIRAYRAVQRRRPRAWDRAIEANIAIARDFGLGAPGSAAPFERAVPQTPS